MVGSLVRLQVRASSDASVKQALNETEGRIAAIAAVHKRLYVSGDVGLVALDETSPASSKTWRPPCGRMAMRAR